jgi:hypothetical protein
MSTFIDIDITCPECGDEYRGSIWTAVHAGQDPELKELLLGGELNLTRCTHCSKVIYQDHFVLYQDPAAELIAYVYPEAQRGEVTELEKMMLKGFREAQLVYSEKDRFRYGPTLMFGLGSLTEMLRQEDALAVQSQVAQQLCKQNKLGMVLLRPSQARRLGTMRVLPHTGSASKVSRSEVLKGIEQLLVLNPALGLYAELKKTIDARPEWALPS